jgi:hypothetical protein
VTVGAVPLAPAVTAECPAAPSRSRRAARTLIGYAATVGLVTALVICLRVALQPGTAGTPSISVGHPAAAVPASPELEAVWGLRFTNVIVLADNGGVELRYQVLDHEKAAKIHLGDPMSNQLPTLRVDGSHAQVSPSTVLMHFHHGDTVSGESYSIVYGNAGGVVRSGEYVTIVMKDGLKLKHVQVSS